MYLHFTVIQVASLCKGVYAKDFGGMITLAFPTDTACQAGFLLQFLQLFHLLQYWALDSHLTFVVGLGTRDVDIIQSLKVLVMDSTTIEIFGTDSTTIETLGTDSVIVIVGNGAVWLV